MSDFLGKTALISGGAEGIGLGIARALGKQGMNLVLGDIDAAQLEQAQQSLHAEGFKVVGCRMDVTNADDWQTITELALSKFGKIHMLVNNAGVAGTPGSIEKPDLKDWSWVIDVNLMAIVKGTSASVPHIKAHGEGGWIVNVASMAGMIGIPYAGAYTATKMAVVGLSESWNQELAAEKIKVSVLCPGFVRTRINDSIRNKQTDYLKAGQQAPAQLDPDSPVVQQMNQAVSNGISPDLVGERVVEAVAAGELYVFTHPNFRAVPRARFNAIDQAFERAAESELLVDLLDQAIPDL